MANIQKVQIGGDIITSLSFGLYIDPLDVYRELIQNAVDAYQEAGTPVIDRHIDIQIDRANRRISIRDYAVGLSETEMLKNLFSIGNSKKRGKQLRGFRGIGRLSALGYCKNLIFRSRKTANANVSEIIWDSNAMYQALADSSETDLNAILNKISKIASNPPTSTCPDRFFECVLEGVRSSKNDILLNTTAISNYISEVAPVPFSDNFTFKEEIYKTLSEYLTFEVQISLNNGTPITRPHTNTIFDPKKDLAISTIRGVKPIDKLVRGIEDSANYIDTGIARGWVLEHDYPGALPASTRIRGLRIRIGNMQIGNERILEHLFKETRFNVWCVGEIHICSPNIRANTRRDNLEPSYIVEDLENSIRILADHISDICRKYSAKRNTTRKIQHISKKVSYQKYEKILKDIDIQKPFPNKLTITPE